MPPEIIPENQPPTPPQPTDTRERARTIVCECCGSKLDRHGNLLRRGDLAKQMIDMEDRERELRKTITKAEEQNAALRAEIDSLKSQIPTAAERKSLWQREA